MQMLQPNEKETEELRDHVIIAGFGRVGQIIAQLLSEMFIPFVALDVKADRVQVCLLPANHRPIALCFGTTLCLCKFPRHHLIITNFNATDLLSCTVHDEVNHCSLS